MVAWLYGWGGQPSNSRFSFVGAWDVENDIVIKSDEGGPKIRAGSRARARGPPAIMTEASTPPSNQAMPCKQIAE